MNAHFSYAFTLSTNNSTQISFIIFSVIAYSPPGKSPGNYSEMLHFKNKISIVHKKWNQNNICFIHVGLVVNRCVLRESAADSCQ